MTKAVLRIIFVLACAGIGYHFYRPNESGFNHYGLILGLSASLAIVALEIGFARRFLDYVPIVMLGLIFGFIAAHLVLQALFLLPFFENYEDELYALDRKRAIAQEERDRSLDRAEQKIADLEAKKIQMLRDQRNVDELGALDRKLSATQAERDRGLARAKQKIADLETKKSEMLRDQENVEKWKNVIRLSATFVLVYLAVLVILQTKDDFKFIIPYVEFARQSKGSKPMIIDTSVIIDGRIADICETKIIDSVLVIPRFVLAELQAIADSSDRMKRKRGRRGLDILHKLQESPGVEVRINDSRFPATKEVDAKLIQLAKKLEGKLVTTDFNLNKVATLQSVEVVNINDLATALRPVVLPGEIMNVELIREGEEAGQGVGYLDDGTMVVVDNGRDVIGSTVGITITSVLQTSAGKMIFGKVKKTENRS